MKNVKIFVVCLVISLGFFCAACVGSGKNQIVQKPGLNPCWVFMPNALHSRGLLSGKGIIVRDLGGIKIAYFKEGSYYKGVVQFSPERTRFLFRFTFSGIKPQRLGYCFRVNVKGVTKKVFYWDRGWKFVKNFLNIPKGRIDL